MTLRVPEKIANLSTNEYQRQESYTPGEGRGARLDDAFVRIGAAGQDAYSRAVTRAVGAAEDTIQTGVRLYEDWQETRGLEAYNRFQRIMGDRSYGENGLFSRQGEAALTCADDMDTALHEAADNLTEEMQLSDAARQTFDRKVWEYGRQAMSKARQHALIQREQWLDGQFEAGMALELEGFLHSADDRTSRLMHLNAMQEHHQRQAARKGWSPEQAAQEWNKARSDAYRALVDRHLESGKVAEAKQLAATDELWLESDRPRVQARVEEKTKIQALKTASDQAREEAQARETALNDEADRILSDTEGYPGLEDQRLAALARADNLDDPEQRAGVRLRIEQEFGWRKVRQDAAHMREALAFADQTQGLSPMALRQRLLNSDLSDQARKTALSWLEGADKLEGGSSNAGSGDEESSVRLMALMRAIDRSRDGLLSLSEDEVLATGLHIGLSHARMGAVLSYLNAETPVTVGRVDDICLDLGMKPDSRGRVEAPGWLYRGVLADLTRHGLLAPDRGVTDDEVTKAVTRVWQRQQLLHNAQQTRQTETGSVVTGQEETANSTVSDALLRQKLPDVFSVNPPHTPTETLTH